MHSIINKLKFFFDFKIAICLLGFLRYRQGIANVFGSYEDPSQSNYASNTETTTATSNDPYRQAPFNTNANSLNGGGYQQPTY